MQQLRKNDDGTFRILSEREANSEDNWVALYTIYQSQIDAGRGPLVAIWVVLSFLALGPLFAAVWAACFQFGIMGVLLGVVFGLLAAFIGGRLIFSFPVGAMFINGFITLLAFSIAMK